MTDAVIVAIVGAVPSTVAALIGLRNGKKISENTDTTDKTNQLVNGHAAAATAALKLVTEQRDAKDERIKELERDRDLRIKAPEKP